MLKNYLKIAYRSLRRHPGYTFINVFGLAVGIAFCVLLLLYVKDELTYDRFHEKEERLFRVQRVTYSNEEDIEEYDVYLPMPLGTAMRTDFPDVEQVVRFCNFIRHFVRKGALTVEERVLYADSSFFDVFTFPLMEGDGASALSREDGVVLSEQAAIRYFGEESPLGKTLEIRLENEFRMFTVTGVAENPPNNSSIQFSILLPFQTLSRELSRFEGSEVNWSRSAFITYVVLKEGSTLPLDTERLLAFREHYYPGVAQELRASGRWSGDGPPVSYALQPIRQVHLDTRVPGGISSPSDPVYSYVLLGIALAVLSIACINFMTLALGRSLSRAREVGVRKVVGARRRQLMRQFWGESFFQSVLALSMGIFVAYLFTPMFNTLTGKSLEFDVFSSPWMLLPFVSLALLTSLIAGGYPAVVLSSFKPVDILRSRMSVRSTRGLTRAMVVVQFTLSVVLVISSLVMLKQLNFLRTQQLGFNQEQVIAVELNDVDAERALALMKSELESRVDVVSVAAANLRLGAGAGWGRQGFDYQGELRQVYEYRVTTNYLQTLGMELAVGRDFDSNRSADTLRAAIVNEALVKEFGWTDPIGQVLTGYHDNPAMDPVIIGVVKDYNFLSLREEVEPMILMASTTTGEIRTLLIKIQSADLATTVEAVRTVWNRVAFDIPFEYSFMEEDIARFYDEEERWSQIIGYSSLFAILIACLGLFGLTAVIVTRRTKEVGIRKVLGASVTGIVGLLSIDFLKLVVLAFILAAPVAYFIMKWWLEGFAYRIVLDYGMFLIAGVLSSLIAFLTVSFQAIKAAMTNPVNTLRRE